MKKLFSIFAICIIFSVHIFSGISRTDKPLNGKWDLKLKKIWEVDSAGENVFGEVQNIRTSDDGMIYIADRKNSIIFILDKDGKFVSSFGKKGEGPGEIKEYFGGDQLNVLKQKVIFADRSRIHYFDLKGNYLYTKTISVSLKPRSFISENIFISAPVTVINKKGGLSKIELFDLKTGEKKVLKHFRPFEKATDTKSDGGRRVTIGIVIGGITPMMIVNYKNGKIYSGMSSNYKIEVFNLAGKKLTELGVAGKKPKKVSDKYKKKLESSLGDVPENMLKNILNGLPPHASYFQNIEIDNNGYIYVILSDPDNESGREIDIFSPESKYIYSSKFNLGDDLNIQNLYLNNDLLITAVEDEDGNVKIIKYIILLPD